MLMLRLMLTLVHPASSGTVTELRLSEFNLAGSIPSAPSIWEPFSLSLKKLTLSGGNRAQVLTGTIPPSLSLLSNLQILDLRRNGQCWILGNNVRAGGLGSVPPRN